MPGGDSFDDYMAAATDRGFGDLELRRHVATAAIRRGQAAAAANLLDKALRALADEDDSKADALVTRALALPYDEAEEGLPAAWEAHMLLFNAVTDEVEGSDDDLWLTAAESITAHVGEAARHDLRAVLQVIDNEYALDVAERRRLRALVRSLPTGSTLENVEAPSSQTHQHLIAVLHAVLAYESAVATLCMPAVEEPAHALTNRRPSDT